MSKPDSEMTVTDILQMADKLRDGITAAHQAAANKTVSANAGAGMIRVVMNGQHQIVELKIDPKAVDPKEVKLLEDLIRAAVNQATQQVATMLQNDFGQMLQGMDVDMGALGLDPNAR